MENDYYSTVYSWFDKCGIISNIRTHLRHNLVNALKNRDLAQKFEGYTPKSAKQYVYDLLIAEYLWNHNYVYTLSVFASEAPLLVNFNKQIKSNNAENDTNTRQKLQSDYVCHTLETLGIEPTKAKGQSIIREYAKNDVPLLLCILQHIRKIDDNCCTTNEERCEGKSTKHQEVQTDESREKVLQEMSKIGVAKKKLIRQKELFDAQLRQKEIELREQTNIMDKQLSTLQDKLEQAQKLMDSYNMKEQQLNENQKQENLRISQKETELTIREKQILREAKRLEKERDSYRQFEGDLKKLQDELSKVKRDIPQTERSCNFSTNDAQVQTDFESFVLARNERNLLSQEKQDLNGLVQEQQSRIEQLTSKVVYLSRKLEETQLKCSRNVEMPSPIIKVLNTNTIISESSSTEDILQDAKMRLRRLEEESIKAEQYYFNYITNSSQ